jgi:hypothetical protein
MLIESEHSIAREDRDGSGVEMEFIAVSPGSFWEVFWGRQERGN